MMAESRAVKKDRVATQQGSTPKNWDREELLRCGAIGTAEQRFLDLRGEFHPVFASWVGADDGELWRRLEQPLLLASRIIESAGLQWLSDFVIEDIFNENYPGREPSCAVGRSFATDDNREAPRTIVRHHRAPWATPEQKRKWLVSTQRRLRNEIASSITWQLDADMFPQKYWVGYTCRHPRKDLSLDELDRYETIKKFDKTCRDRRYRDLTVLVTAEYPRRMAELRRRGLAHGEEYLLTAFMTTITILHELGHAIYWKDSRSLTHHLREPFYGGDLEMELGDSFVAAVFGGWVPVPVGGAAQLHHNAFSFAGGLAWKQSLSWDYHRLRPKHRTHYSIPVEHIAKLFDEQSWFSAASRPEKLIRPYSLLAGRGRNASSDGLPLLHPAFRAQHASAALPDFYRSGDFNGSGWWSWNRRTGARFRIPQYDGCVCPELDLPTATDDVIVEPAPLDPRGSVSSSSSSSLSSSRSSHEQWRQSRSQSQSPRRFSLVATKKDRRDSRVGETTASNRDSAVSGVSDATATTPAAAAGKAKPAMKTTMAVRTKADRAPSLESPREEDIPRVRLSRGQGQKIDSNSNSSKSPDRGEISVDELKKRLSRIIGVSMTELEKLFDAPPCT